MERKIHNVSWKKIYQPKNLRGLGFINLRMMTSSYMIKHTWKLNKESNALWASVLKSKYARDCNWRNKIKVQNSNSKLWKDIVWIFNLQGQAW